MLRDMVISSCLAEEQTLLSGYLCCVDYPSCFLLPSARTCTLPVMPLCLSLITWNS